MNNKALDVEKIRAHITADCPEIKLFDVIDSTNTEARRHLLCGGVAPCIFIASKQTEGRGRLGRSFYSPADTGAYFSLLLADGGERDTVLITSAAAVAVKRAIYKTTGIKTEIKWVNDLYYNDRKVCGILAESVFLGGERYVILGVGINVSTEDFPEELSGKAGSLGQSTEIGNGLVGECLKQLLDFWGDLDPDSFMDEYRESSMVLGKDVIYTVNGVEKAGVAKGIDQRGRLSIKHEDGSIAVLSSGEISLRVNKK